MYSTYYYILKTEHSQGNGIFRFPQFKFSVLPPLTGVTLEILFFLLQFLQWNYWKLHRLVQFDADKEHTTLACKVPLDSFGA